MRICICGGGNAVHVMASDMGARDDLWVGIYAPFQDEAERMQAGLDAGGGKISRHLRGQITEGKPDLVSADPALVVPDADVVLIPLPSFSHESTLREIGPYLKDGCIVVALPGQGGFNWLARSVLGAEKFSNIVVAGTNQLPYQCRVLEYGSSVDLIGHKRQVKVATEPSDRAGDVARLLTNLIGVTEVVPLPNFLTVALTPANQVIHPTIMYGLFHDYTEPLAEPPLFYQNTDDFTAEVMQKTSDEVLAIASALQAAIGQSIPVPALDDMMREMYADELEDASTMKSIFRTNLGYQGLFAPMIKTDDGRFAPNFGYRYLTEDIPRGQCVLKGLALLAGVATPTIDRLIRWAGSVMGIEYLSDDGEFNPKILQKTAAPQAFGLSTIEAIRR
jgi:NAD/NADP octopine/nopaline dehydrogenase, alpha-helical domain